MTIRILHGDLLTSVTPAKFSPTPGYKWKIFLVYLVSNVNATLTSADNFIISRQFETNGGTANADAYVKLTSGLSIGQYSGDMSVTPSSQANTSHTQISEYPVLSEFESVEISILNLNAGDTYSYYIVIEETKA